MSISKEEVKRGIQDYHEHLKQQQEKLRVIGIKVRALCAWAATPGAAQVVGDVGW